MFNWAENLVFPCDVVIQELLESVRIDFLVQPSEEQLADLFHLESCKFGFTIFAANDSKNGARYTIYPPSKTVNKLLADTLKQMLEDHGLKVEFKQL